MGAFLNKVALSIDELVTVLAASTQSQTIRGCTVWCLLNTHSLNTHLIAPTDSILKRTSSRKVHEPTRLAFDTILFGEVVSQAVFDYVHALAVAESLPLLATRQGRHGLNAGSVANNVAHTASEAIAIQRIVGFAEWRDTYALVAKL